MSRIARSGGVGGVSTGDVLNDTYDVGPTIGSGTYSQVFQGAYLRKHKVALKVDKPGPRPDALKWESDVLESLQRFPFFARHYGFITSTSGQNDVLQTNPRKTVSALAMQLLGPNVSELRRTQPGEQLPLLAVLHISERMLFCLEAVHSVGYLHRDVKPSNFAVGLNKDGVPFVGRAGVGGGGGARSIVPGAGTSTAQEGLAGQLYCFDFGQSRQYIIPGTHQPRPARESAEFRGTSLYSSLHAHALQDQGRRDDLISWMYVLLDLARGGLPWRVCKDARRRCEVLKRYYDSHPSELVADLPGASILEAMYRHVSTLPFHAKPDYAFLAQALHRVQAEVKAQGLEYARLRPAYVESEDLAGVLASLRGEEEAKYGAEVAGTAAAPETYPALKGADSLSPPQLKAIPEGQIAIDTALVSVFDCTRLRTSVDGVLHSRGGAWGAHRYDGVMPATADADESPAAGDADMDAVVALDQVLRVQANGDPTHAARVSVSALQAARKECETILAGTISQHVHSQAYMSMLHSSATLPSSTEALHASPESVSEWDEEGIAVERVLSSMHLQAARVADAGQATALWIAGSPAPAWLAAFPRSMPGAGQPSLPDSYADRTVAWTLLDGISRLRRLHHECLWAAAAAVSAGTTASAAPVVDGEEDASSTGREAKRARVSINLPVEPRQSWRTAVAVQAAVNAYVTAWCSIAKAVLAKHAKHTGKAGKDAGELAPLLSSFVFALLRAAKSPPQALDAVGASSHLPAEAKIVVQVATEALSSLGSQGSSGCLAVELLTTTAGSAIQLAVNAQLFLAQAENMAKSFKASGLVDSTLSVQHEGDDMNSEDAEVLEEAQKSLEVLDMLLGCIKRERELSRAPALLDWSSATSPSAAATTTGATVDAEQQQKAAMPRSLPSGASVLPALPALSAQPDSLPPAAAAATASTGQAVTGAPRKSRWDKPAAPAVPAQATTAQALLSAAVQSAHIELQEVPSGAVEEGEENAYIRDSKQAEEEDMDVS